MCNIWRGRSQTELSSDAIERILKSGFGQSIRIVTLTGGEPTLRNDLPNILALILESCPQLEHLTLATNGLSPELTIQQVNRCLDQISEAAVQPKKVLVQVSLDGIGKVHDKVRGVPGAYHRVLETCGSLLNLANECAILQLGLSCVVQPDNVSNLRQIRELADSMNAPVLFSPLIFSPDYYGNMERQDSLRMGTEQAMEARAFFEELSERESSSWRFYYKDVSRMLSGATRGRKCMMGFYGFVLEHDGDIYPCVNCERASFGSLERQAIGELWFHERAKRVRRGLREHCCPTCASACYALPVNAKEVGSLLLGRLRQH